MFAFFLKILFCLFLAAALGFVLAWLLRGLAMGRLREQHGRLTSDLAARESQLTAAQGQMQESRNQAKVLEHDLSVSRNRGKEFELALQGEQQRSTKLADDVRHERERFLALENIAKRRAADLETAHVQLANTTRDKDFEIVRLSSQLAPLVALPAALSARDGEIKALQSRIDELASLSDRQESESVTQLASFEAKVRVSDDELSRRSARVAELERIVAAEQSRLAELDSIAQARAGQIASLQGESMAIQNRLSTLGDSKDGEVRALQAKLNEATLALRQRELELAGARKQLETELTSLRGRSDADLSQFKSRIASLSSDLQGRDSSLSTVRVELDAARKTLESRSSLLRDLETKHAASGETLKAKDAELARLRAQVSLLTPLSTKQTTLESDLSASRERVGALESELACLTDERKNAEWQYQQSASTLEQQLRDSVAARGMLEKELDKARSVPAASSKRTPRQFAGAPPLIDDLKHIYGVGPVLEKMLHALGVYQFIQVATWKADDIAFFDARLHDFHGRIEREHWVRSAQEEHYKKYGEWLGEGAPVVTMPETNR